MFSTALHCPDGTFPPLANPDDNGLLFAVCGGGCGGYSLDWFVGEYEGGGLEIGDSGVLSRDIGGLPGFEKSRLAGEAICNMDCKDGVDSSQRRSRLSQSQPEGPLRCSRFDILSSTSFVLPLRLKRLWDLQG